VFFLFVLVFSFLGLHSFEFNISEFELVDDAPLVNLLDQNNDICALVIVNSNIKDVYFHNKGLGIFKKEYDKKKGQYLLYIPYGSKTLIIKHEKYVPIEYKYDKRIDRTKTYKLTLETKPGSKDPSKFSVIDNTMVLRSLEEDPFDVDVRIKNDENCKSAIKIFSDLPIELIHKIFLEDKVRLSCDESREDANKCSDGEIRAHKNICIKNPVNFNDLLNGTSDIRLKAGFYPNVPIKEKSTYKLFIDWE
jgi:hypothetical protein